MAEPEGIRGFDTETYRGYVKVLCASNGDFLESHETEELLTWLFRLGRESHNVFFNVGYDLQCIVKPWVVEQGGPLKQLWLKRMEQRARMRELEAKGELSLEERFELGSLHQAHAEASVVDMLDINDEMRVRYMHNKGFTITLGDSGKGASVSFYDGGAFYRPDHANISLDAAAKQYLGRGKNAAELGISAKRIGNEAGYYEANRDKIIIYCIEDALLVAELQALTVASHATLELPWPKHPWSKASVHKEYWKHLPHLKAEVDFYADQYRRSPWKPYWDSAYHGGIFLVRHLGSFDAGWDADINSAYPWVMTTLRSIVGSRVVKYGEREFESAEYQFFKVHVRPTPRVLDNTHIDGLLRYHYAAEPRELWMTHWDLKTLDLYGDAYEVIDGIGVLCDPAATLPFEYLLKVFDKKAKVKTEYGKKSVMYNNIKVFANSGSGALAQRKPAESKWTNLIFASHVTSRVRHAIWSIIRELEQAGDNLISVKTDGITVEGTHARSRMLARSSDKLGGIEVEPVYGGVSFENGVYLVREHDGSETFRHRGLRSVVKMHRRTCKSKADCDCEERKLVDALRSCNSPSLTVDRAMPLSMVRAIIQERAEDIAVFEEDQHTLFPARAALRNFDVPEYLFTMPLGEYFNDGWTLDWGHHP